MIKFKHRVIIIGNDVPAINKTKKFNELGEKGWELITSTTIDEKIEYVFKKEIAG